MGGGQAERRGDHRRVTDKNAYTTSPKLGHIFSINTMTVCPNLWPATVHWQSVVGKHCEAEKERHHFYILHRQTCPLTFNMDRLHRHLQRFLTHHQQAKLESVESLTADKTVWFGCDLLFFSHLFNRYSLIVDSLEVLSFITPVSGVRGLFQVSFQSVSKNTCTFIVHLHSDSIWACGQILTDFLFWLG